MRFDNVSPPAGRPPELSEEAWHEVWFGSAAVSPRDDVVAGSTGTWTLTYRVGRYGFDDGGTLKIAFRWASDWGYPQTTDPAAANYATVATSGPATVGARFETKGFRRPWQRCLTVDVFDDSLGEGDTITVVFGDTSGGGPGSVAQTFVETAFELKVVVDCHGAGWFAELPRNPTLRVVAGEPAALRVVNPTLAVAGRATWVGVRVEDAWGNPTGRYTGTIALTAPGLRGLPGSVTCTPEDGGARRLEAVAGEPGLVRVEAIDDVSGLRAAGNPLELVAERPALVPLWGDLHGQSGETVGTGTIAEYYAFGRDKAFADFLGHQGNDFQITRGTWAELQRVAREEYQPGRFVPLLGYEWSGTTPAGGDRNVYLADAEGELHRSSHWLVPDRSDADTDASPVTALFEALRGKDALIVAHVGGRYADLAWHDEELERLVEVWSAWGRFDWFRDEALRRGYTVGFTAGSDGHKGRPAASPPGSAKFGVYGGLTCVLAADHTREAIWEALRARRTYGTSGVRMAIDCRIGGHLPGEVVDGPGGPIEVEVTAHGTAPIERVELYRDTDVVAAAPEPIERAVGRRLRVIWSGARVKARGRLQDWSGRLEILGGGRIVGVEPYHFDSPAEGIREWASDRVAWSSWTAGDDDGVILQFEPGAQPSLRFITGWCDLELRALPEPAVVPLGGLDLRLTVEWEPLGFGAEPGILRTTVEPRPGRAAYWVHVRQTDGNEAWVSPVYL